MTTVKIDIAQIGSAITAATDLADHVDQQQQRAAQASPISLPSLEDGSLAKKSRWLTDHLEDLTSRRDLAILLDQHGTGSATYQVASDTLTNVQEMLGRELAHATSGLGPNPDPDDLDRIAGMLATWSKDPEVMSAMYRELGPDGTVGAMANIESAMRLGAGGDAEKLTAFADQLRAGLATASDAWPPTEASQYGRDLVRYCVAPMLTDDEQQAFGETYGMGMSGANILSYFMQNHDYSDDFLLGAANTLDEFERMSKDGIMPADVWYSHNGYGTLPTGNTGGWYDDPMAAIMHNFGDNPQAGLTFFTQPTADGWNRQDYYFDKREWKADGYAGISHAVEGIGTDPTNLTDHGRDTTHLVSAFFDYVADSDGFNPEDAKAASPYVADLMKFYMPAVDSTLRNGANEGDPASTFLSIDHFGTFDDYPVLYKNDLNSLMQVAMSTKDGTQSIAEGVGSYQKIQLNNLAAELAANPDDPGLRTELRDVLQRNASLQGFTEYSVGQVEIDGAASRDAQRQAFIDLVSDAAGMVPMPGADAVGEVGSKLIDFGWSQATNLGTDAAGDAWTSEAASATDDYEQRAEAASTRVKIDTYVSLVEAGVIPRDEVPDQWYRNGRMVDVGDLSDEELGSYAQSAMNGVNEFATNFDLEGAYRESFQHFYQPVK